jgi:hypothetical protein
LLCRARHLCVSLSLIAPCASAASHQHPQQAAAASALILPPPIHAPASVRTDALEIVQEEKHRRTFGRRLQEV